LEVLSGMKYFAALARKVRAQCLAIVMIWSGLLGPLAQRFFCIPPV
jgi:hypothetical protein